MTTFHQNILLRPLAAASALLLRLILFGVFSATACAVQDPWVIELTQKIEESTNSLEYLQTERDRLQQELQDAQAALDRIEQRTISGASVPDQAGAQPPEIELSQRELVEGIDRLKNELAVIASKTDGYDSIQKGLYNLLADAIAESREIREKEADARTALDKSIQKKLQRLVKREEALPGPGMQPDEELERKASVELVSLQKKPGPLSQQSRAQSSTGASTPVDGKSAPESTKQLQATKTKVRDSDQEAAVTTPPVAVKVDKNSKLKERVQKKKKKKIKKKKKKKRKIKRKKNGAKKSSVRPPRSKRKDRKAGRKPKSKASMPWDTDTANTVIIDNFNELTGTNSRGNSFNAYARAPSLATFDYVQDTINNVDSGVLKLDFEKHSKGGPYGKGGWCGFYSVVKDGATNAYFDGRNYSAITFWVRGATGDENFAIGLADKRWEQLQDSIKSKPITWYLGRDKIGKKWHKVSVPLEDFALDRSKLASVAIAFEGYCFPDRSGRGTVFIERLAFEK